MVFAKASLLARAFPRAHVHAAGANATTGGVVTTGGVTTGLGDDVARVLDGVASTEPRQLRDEVKRLVARGADL